MEKNKKEKIIIGVLLIILAILLIRLLLLYKENGLLGSKDTGNSHIYSNNSNQRLTMLENEDSLQNDLYLDEGVSKNSNDEKLVSQNNYFPYMDIFPDMYVERVKPIIQLKERKVAYLTFDDGPSRITKDILITLEEEEIKATFFVIGSTLTEEGEECLKMMVEQGHEIGIHTYSHNYKKIYASVEAYLEDFYLVYQQVYEITGVKPRIFRFPWGSINSYNKKINDELIVEMERRGFTYYDWNVSAEDSLGHPTEYKIWKNIMKDIEKFTKPIILMHDSSVNRLTANTLEKVIKSIRDKGYDFDTLNHRVPYQFGKKEK